MGSTFKRGNRWYIQFKDENGRWRTRAAADTKREAKAVLAEVEALIESRSIRAPLVDEWVETWLERRKQTHPRSHKKTVYVVRAHVLKHFTGRRLDAISRPDVKRWVEAIQATHAPRTVLGIHSVARKLFADAVYDELLAENPFSLGRGRLPEAIDRDPEWRAGAVFSAEEVEALISDPEIPQRRRALYALLFLTGARVGEAGGLRWRHWEPRVEPLGRLVIAHSFDQRTKTNHTRLVPVHPTLQRALARWKAEGWAERYGREPGPDDLVVPHPEDAEAFLCRKDTWRWLQRDLNSRGLKPRRVHDTKRTFITLARAGGARADVLRHVTHSARGDIIDLYSSLPWPLLCETVTCLKVGVVETRGFDAATPPDGKGLTAILTAPVPEAAHFISDIGDIENPATTCDNPRQHTP